MKQQNRKISKTPLIFRVGLILMCAMMISCYMMSGIYARYSTTATGNATARTAGFDCEVISSYIDEKYAVQITNNSEVTVKYSVECSELPEGVLLRICDIDGNLISEQNRNLKSNDTVAFVVEITENYVTPHERIDAGLTIRVEQVN